MFEILKDKEIEILTSRVFDVLEKLGMFCENEEILKAVEEKGAHVDYKKEVAKFPKRIIQEFINEIQKEDKAKWEEEIKGDNKRTIYSGYVPQTKKVNKFEAPHPPYIFHSLATFFYDDEKKERRTGNKTDFINLTKLGDCVHPESDSASVSSEAEDGVGHSLNLSDVPPPIEPLEAASLLIEYSHNPKGVYVQDIKQIDYLLEIKEIAGIENQYWCWLANVGFASPLKLGKDIADRFVYMCKLGIYPAKVYSMAISGVNLPVTAGGSIVISSAEFIVLWFCAKALNPNLVLTGMVLSGVSDMRTGDVNYWSFDALIRRFSICEFLRKLTGVNVSAGVGEFSSPSKLPGVYTTLEKAYLAMTIASFTGYHPDLGIGHLECGLTISPVQFLLDREFTKGLKFLESPVIDEEQIGLNTILDIGFGKDVNYLQAEHTLKNFKNCLWNTEFFNSLSWSRDEEEKNIKKVREKINEIIGTYKKPEIDETKISKIKKVIEKAKKNLL